MIVIGQGASQAQVIYKSLSQAEILARLGDSSFACGDESRRDPECRQEGTASDSPEHAEFWELLRLCRRNSETACLMALWGRARPEVKRKMSERSFLRKHVLPHLNYTTTLDALNKAVLRAI